MAADLRPRKPKVANGQGSKVKDPLEELRRDIAELRGDVARILQLLEPGHAAAPIAVSAAEVARLLSIKRDVVYQLHRDGTLNGFRPYPTSYLKFLLAEARAVAQRMSDQPRHS